MESNICRFHGLVNPLLGEDGRRRLGAERNLAACNIHRRTYRECTDVDSFYIKCELNKLLIYCVPLTFHYQIMELLRCRSKHHALVLIKLAHDSQIAQHSTVGFFYTTNLQKVSNHRYVQGVERQILQFMSQTCIGMDIALMGRGAHGSSLLLSIFMAKN